MTGPLHIEPSGHNAWRVTDGSGNVAATIKWSGEHQVVRDRLARPLGTLWRSDGRVLTGQDGQWKVTYAWRAYLPDIWATPPQGCGHSQRLPGAEVARCASHEDAVAALLAAGGQ